LCWLRALLIPAIIPTRIRSAQSFAWLNLLSRNGWVTWCGCWRLCRYTCSLNLRPARAIQRVVQAATRIRTVATNQLWLPSKTASVSGFPSAKSIDFSQTGRRGESTRFRGDGIFSPARLPRSFSLSFPIVIDCPRFGGRSMLRPYGARVRRVRYGQNAQFRWLYAGTVLTASPHFHSALHSRRGCRAKIHV